MEKSGDKCGGKSFCWSHPRCLLFGHCRGVNGGFWDNRREQERIIHRHHILENCLKCSETLSAPTAPRVSPEMQLSYTSNSTLSWNIINPFWAAFCSSHGVICLSRSLPIHLWCFSLLPITMSYKYLPHKTSGCALIVHHGVCSIPPALVWVWVWKLLLAERFLPFKI